VLALAEPQCRTLRLGQLRRGEVIDAELPAHPCTENPPSTGNVWPVM
jgi:hypothetical protein